MWLYDKSFPSHFFIFFFFLAQRGNILYCLSQVGPGGQRSLGVLCVRACVRLDLCSEVVTSHRCFPACAAGVCFTFPSPGLISVNEHFHHLTECQSLLSDFTSTYPTDKYGKSWLTGGERCSGGVDSHLMHILALRQANIGICLSYCLLITQV